MEDTGRFGEVKLKAEYRRTFPKRSRVIVYIKDMNKGRVNARRNYVDSLTY